MSKDYNDDAIFNWEKEVDEVMELMGLHKTGHPTDMWAARRECPADLDDLDLYTED